MAIHSKYPGCLSVVFAAIGFAMVPVLAGAEPSDAPIPSKALVIVDASQPAAQSRAVSAEFPLVPEVADLITRPTTGSERSGQGPSGLLVTLYGSFGALQGADLISTRAALKRGGHEANPVMAGLTGNAFAFTSVKIGTAVGTIYLAEKLRKKNPRTAMVLMAALNTTYAIVVWNNSRVLQR